ncbi:DUF3519 domain-containing protein [Helicobacter pylori]|uniref:DUF3519 domain-containing protein n=3 Tax=Helicobacter pylori TaxID=210 RepID=UPI001E36C6F1|nr:DUF3519 domain-containing protein [Helicobacter pylori]
MKLPKALNEATAGAALKYHLKRALERSHTISEFSKNLELSAQNAKFSNNTLKIIEELTNGVKQASEEIKEKAFDFSNEKLTNEQIKELLNNAEIPTSGRDAITFGVNNLNPEMVEFLHKNNKKMIIEKASNKELELLQDANFKHPENIRASLDHDAIAHILKRHGVNSVNVKNGESPITYEDIANYRYIVNNADAILRTIDKYNQEAITAFKQINGYAVVVEQAVNKKNELVLKTMYKNNGSYKNNDVYKEFSSTSLKANAKVPHGLSSHSGATDNSTQKPLKDQEDLLKRTENLNETTQEVKNLSPLEQANAKNAKFSNNTLKIIEELNNGVKQASEEIKEKARDFSNEKLTNEQIKELLNNAEIPTSGRDAITFGVNNLNPEMVEFIHKNNKKMIIEKASNKELELLADAHFKHPENIRASLDHDAITHILKRHGVNSVNVKNGESPITYEDIANYRYIVNNADAILRTIDKYNQEAITAFKQINGYAVVVEQAVNKKNELVLKTMYKNNGSYKNNDVYKEFSSTSLNANAKVPHGLSSHSGATDNSTQKPLKDQEDLLKRTENLNETTQEVKNFSPLEQANAKKLAKLESEAKVSEQEFLKAKEQELKRKEALKKKLEHERGNAGNIESQTKIEVGEDIPTQIQTQIPKSRVRLNEREIYDLDYAIVKAKDLKPSFTTGGTQKRTDMNEEQIKSIAENFDPKKIFGSGGFEDLPIILHDGQVIAGNHRIQGMLNFTPKSRYIYNKAIKEYYHIDLEPDELLVRVPHKRLDNTEINNLAASSNQGRFNSESDHAIAVLSHYEAKLKELDKKLDADNIYSLKNIVAKNLNFDKATHPNVGDSNLALLMFNMPRTKTQGIELLNRWQKAFSNDIKSYGKVKKMFVDNAGSFHNLIHDMNFPKVSLNAYLSDIMDRSFANLKNYQTTSESLKDLSEKFYKTSSLEMFEKSDQSVSDISEILGGAIARFARFDDPSNALFEALKSDNIKKGLKEFKIADITKDMFDPKSKEFKDIDIYDFTHYLLMVNREPNENNPVLNRLVQAVKDMQKESEKGIKKPKLETPSEWGPNYSEFKNDGLGAINKLLETKKGFVAGAFHKEGLGDIDLVWGSKDYGLEHILKRRIESYIKKGLKPEFAEQRALNLVRMIPEAIEKGKVGRDAQGRLKIETKDILVALRDNWQGEPLKSRWVITGFEKKVGNLREQAKFIDPSLITKDGEHLASSLNSVEPNPTTKKLNKD